MKYPVRQTLVPRNVTRGTNLRGTQSAPELALRSTEFRSPENLIFPALPTRKNVTKKVKVLAELSVDTRTLKPYTLFYTVLKLFLLLLFIKPCVSYISDFTYNWLIQKRFISLQCYILAAQRLYAQRFLDFFSQYTGTAICMIYMLFHDQNTQTFFIYQYSYYQKWI